MSGFSRTWAAGVVLALVGTVVASPPPRPSIVYVLRLDPAHLDVVDVTLEVRDVPTSVHLAMKVHAEYDARYWRYLDDVGVRQTGDDAHAGVVREDSTLWRVSLPGGHGVVHYRLHIQPPRSGLRRAWLPYTRADGALINPPDFFLYVPEFPRVPVRVDLDLPGAWRVATALAPGGTPRAFEAPDATTFLDSPILAGVFHEWSFADRGTIYHVVYWPLPDAAPFDTSGFVDELRRLVGAALDVFARAPARDYYFLIEDGAADALEHGASVTIGVPSERLARDARASLTEIAHEFFHTWNLVAIRPAGYNRLSYRPPARTPGLWLGEGVTLYYADALPRRAGLAAPTPTRLDHLAALLERYYGSPALLGISPERASLAFGDSPTTNPDATGGYYLQGELLGSVLDARVREATEERRGLDDVMRALFDRSRVVGDSGFGPQEVESVMAAVCACSVDAFFAAQVRGPGPIDLTPVLARLGLQVALDSVPATDSLGRALPDLRLGTDFTAPAGMVRLVVANPATPWARAGLRTGDELLKLSDSPVNSVADLQAALRGLRVGDRAKVEVRRGGRAMALDVAVSGYVRPRVRFKDRAHVTAADEARRAAWLGGR